jgi:hypothetical protein
VEAVPVPRGDACGDGVVGVLRGDGLAESDGDKQASGGALGIYCWVDGAGLDPVLTKGSDVLLGLEHAFSILEGQSDLR